MINNFVGEHYLIERELGNDQFGKVYLGQDTRYPSEMSFPPVAIRIISNRLSEIPGFAERFATIAPKLQACNQINSVRVLAQGKSNTANGEVYYIVTEMPAPNLLGQHIQNQRQLSPEQAGAIFDQLCGAIEYGQRQGIIHGNLNIWNITMREDGKIQLVDMGLMQMLLPFTLAEQEQQLGWKVPVGIPEFLAPERFRGEAPTKYNDVYVIGVILYLMISGKMPYTGNYEQLVVAHSYQQQPPLGPNVRNNIELNQFFSRILSKNQLDRYTMQDASIRFRQAAGLFRSMLPVFETHPPLPAPPPPPEEEQTKKKSGWRFGNKR